MAGGFGPVVRHLHRAAALSAADDVPDGRLLADFLARRDEAAFEALVRRHGPMVLGVCRRLLRDPHAAEDAFQATFLVLARGAAGIDKQASVGSWLHGVARRVALKARGKLSRRRERGMTDVATTDPEPGAAWAELRTVLDEEVERLPEECRAPFVLCYLEGRTYDEAARRLGWPRGTVSTRLARARGLLQEALTRRGMSLAAGLLVSLLTERAASAVPPALVASTAQAAALAAGGAAAAGVVSVRATALAEGVMSGMTTSTLKLVTVIFLMAGLAGLGPDLSGVPPHAAPGEPARASAAGPAPAPRPPERDPVAVDKERLQGTWAPVSAEARGNRFPDAYTQTFRLTFDGDKAISRVGESTDEGTYRIDPTGAPRHIDLTTAGGRTSEGIYRFDGNRLTVLTADPGGVRPRGFVATTAGTEFALLVFERVDPQAAANRWKVRHTLGGHAGQVAAVAVSPDGRAVVSSDRAGAVRLWDVATGAVRSELKGHARFVHLLAFSPDGSAVAGASPDGSARVWDTADGKVRTVLAGKTDGFSTLAYSPDGRAVVATYSAGDFGRVTG